MEILETKGRKMNKIKREEREDLHTFSDTTFSKLKNIVKCLFFNIYSLSLHRILAFMSAKHPISISSLRHF